MRVLRRNDTTNAFIERPPSLEPELSERDQLRQAWGEWLGELARWDWFLTLTFRDPESAPGRHWTRVGYAYVNRACEWTLAQWQPTVGALDWVRCFETQRDRQVLHIHALLTGSESTFRWRTFAQAYWQKYGMSRILPYDRELGATYYLTKYVTKDLGDVRFSSNIRSIRDAEVGTLPYGHLSRGTGSRLGTRAGGNDS